MVPENKIKSENKIKVFISSKCGGERINFDQMVNTEKMTKEDIAKRAVKTNYDLIRRALRSNLEATGIITTYVFEDESASTLTAREDYSDALDKSDVCLFLVDNFDDTIANGLLEEITRAQSQNKKSIYLFLNDPAREKTNIQKSMTGAASPRYREIHDLRDFIDEGFQSVINDILRIYYRHCWGHLNYFKSGASSIQLAEEIFPIQMASFDKQAFGNVAEANSPAQMADIDKQAFGNLGLTRNKIASLIFGISKEKEDALSSELDQLCVSILEVLLGERDFNEVNRSLLLEKLAKIQSPRLNELVAERWDAISSFYSGDLDSAITITKSTYDKYHDDAIIPKWVINDILIDWRNLENFNDERKNTLNFSVQEKINQQNSLIFFPLIDRFSTNISDDILDRKVKDLTSSPYSTTFYNLEHVFGYISNYLLTALYYGSRTHIHLSIKEIQRVLFDLVQEENSLRYKIQLMRISVLLGDEDVCIKFFEKYKSSLSHSTAKEILDLYNLADKKTLPHQKAYWKAILFMELGYYFSDIDYQKISNEIIVISRNSLNEDNLNIRLIEKITKALKANKDRFSQDEIAHFGMEILNRRYYRFLDSTFDLLGQLDFSSMPADLISQLLSQIKDILENKEVKGRISNIQPIFVRLRKSQSAFGLEIDKIVEKDYPEFYNNEYHLEFVPGERVIHIQKYLEEIKVRNKVQGKDGRFIMYADNPYITIMNIIELDHIIPSKELLENLVQEMVITLFSETQTYSAKINAIQLLICLKQQALPYNFDWDNRYSNLKQNTAKISIAQTDFFEQESALSLQLYVAVLQAVFGEDPLQNMLEVLALTNNSSVREKIDSLIALGDFLKAEQRKLEGNPLIPIIFQYTSAFCFDDHADIRYHTIPVLYELIDSEYAVFVINRLAKMMDDNDFRVKWTILDQALRIKNLSVSTFNYVIGKARIDNNYLIRKKVDKYASEIEISGA